MNVYAAFMDSDTDPTYTSASECVLVVSDSTGDNPCVGERVSTVIPVMPKSEYEIRAYADLLGWRVDVKDGKLVLLTGVVSVL